MNYKQRLKTNIKLLYFSSFFKSLIFVVPIWVAFERRFLSFSQMAILQSILTAITIILELPTGALADLIGRKKTMIIGWLLRSISCFYMAFSSNFFMFLIADIGFGIADALVSGADIALIFDTFKELNREDDFIKFKARASLIFRMGLTIATFLGGYFYNSAKYLPYVLMGITGIISLIFDFFLIEPSIDSEKFSLTSYIQQTKDGFKELFKTSYMKKLTIFYTFVGGITWSCIYYFDQPFATDIGFNTIELSWLFGSIFLLSSLVVLFLTESKNILTRNRIYIGFPIIMSLSLLPAVFANKIMAPILLFGIRIAATSRFTILDKYTNQEFKSKYRATAVSSLNMLVSLFFIIVVGISGKIQDIYNTKIIYSFLGILTIFLVFPSGISLVKEYSKYKENSKNNLSKLNN
ncbi:MAG: MFS transporter [Patescibacteria group bacterium]|nr:MFS transporter [Patescibacteria group bacterium]